MQQQATNKFIENANRFGNSYEQQIANAFEEIKQNEVEIKESIQELYKGPESFVEKANRDLAIIESNYKEKIEDFKDSIDSLKTRLLIISLICAGLCFAVCLLSAILLVINNSILEFFQDFAKSWSVPLTIIIILLILVLSVWIAYCKGKGSKY